jgi:two-component system, NarL family, sensor kinase
MTAGSQRDPPPPSTTRAVAQFVATGLAALALVAVAGILVVEDLGARAAIRDGGNVAGLVAHGIIEPAVTADLLVGEPAAIAAIDRIVQERVLGGSLTRVKIWTSSGLVIYSDEPLLIGQTFELGEDQSAALATGTMSEPQISDLAAPENQHEVGADRLLEVYVPIRAPDGTALLVESYLRLDAVLTSARLVTGQMLPIVIAALAFLAVAQWPLAWRLARDLRAGHQARERLLTQAIDSSRSERQRIAGDLHDGLVQTLAGVAYDLAGSADRATEPTQAAALERGAGAVRGAMREARSLLVELYPPNLRAVGLSSSVGDLTAALVSRGVIVDADLQDDGSLDETRQALVYRVVQEALRNVAKHSAASRVELLLSVVRGTCQLTIDDDGVGIGTLDLAERRQAGHVGLAMLRDLAADAGAELVVGPRQPSGTRLSLSMSPAT